MAKTIVDIKPDLLRDVTLTVNYTKMFIFRLWLFKILLHMAVSVGGFGTVIVNEIGSEDTNEI